MNTSHSTLICPSFAELREAGRNWKWLLGLGIFSIILGVFALGALTITTLVSIFFLGFLLLANGIVEGIHAFKADKAKEFFFHVSTGVLYAAVGVLFVINPVASAASVTLLLGAFFIAGGVFRIIWAFVTRFRNWGWVVLNGIVTLLLGVIVWADWPISGLWVIGLFVGIEMVINGWSRVMFALALRDEVNHTRLRCAF
jgi:uncharacterized membrane protein HdeD (DUF308 family)